MFNTESTFELSEHEVAWLVECAEVVATERIFASVPEAVAEQCGVRSVRRGSALAVMAAALPMILLNRVIGLGLDSATSEHELDELIALYDDAGIERFAFQLAPTACSEQLVGWLEERGFRHTDNWSKVMRRAIDPPRIATDLRIEAIDASRAELFGATTVAGFGMPQEMERWIAATVGQQGWRHYMAFDGEMAVGTGALHVDGDTGWLGFGSTLPSHRGRGAQGAIMARRIGDGIDLGCRWLVTETGEERPDRPNPSYHNMLRTGFELAYQRGNWVRDVRW